MRLSNYKNKIGHHFYRRVLSAVIVLFILLFSSEIIYSQPKTRPPKNAKDIDDITYDRAFFEKKRDPIFAGMLSWYMPGLGQYYSGEVFKGTSFLVVESAITIGALIYFLDFNFGAGGGSGFKVNVDAKRTDLGVIETSRKNVFLGMLSLVFVIHLINVSDAVISAKNFNKNLEKRRHELKKKYPSFQIGFDENRRFRFGFEKKF